MNLNNLIPTGITCWLTDIIQFPEKKRMKADGSCAKRQPE